MTDLNLVAVVMSAILLAFLLWCEVKRTNRRRLKLRLIVTVVAVVSFLLLRIPVHYQSQSDQPANDIILLTAGYEDDSVQRFLHKQHGTIPVYVSSPKMIAARKYSPSLFTSALANNKTVHIFGQGLNEQQATTLNKNKVVLHPVALSGVISVNWARQLTSGEKLVVAGTFYNRTEARIKLSLQSYGVTLDSVTMSAAGPQPFQLAAIPKQLGRTALRLIAVASGDTLENNPVPIIVNKPSPSTIYLLAAAPDFENKFLKNWLAENGHPVIIDATTSRGRQRRELLNTGMSSQGGLAGNIPAAADVIVADAASLASLSLTQINTLRNWVSQKGGGLVLRTDSARANLFFSALFPLKQPDSSGQNPVRLLLRDSTTKTGVLPLAHIPAIRLTERTASLLRSPSGNVYAAVAGYGAGKIVATTLNNSFAWRLAGNRDAYGALWSALLYEATSARASRAENWQVLSELPSVNEPVEVELQTTRSRLPTGQIGNSAIAMTQDIYFPFRWTGMYWPLNEGWQTGIQLNGEAWYWYVFGANDWPNARATLVQNNMLAHFSDSSTAVSGDETLIVMETVPRYFFFSLFMLAMLLLWMEKKFYDR